MERRKRRDKAAKTTRATGGLKTYWVTFLPTHGPIEVVAENEQEAEELANHAWDMEWDGEFTVKVEEAN